MGVGRVFCGVAVLFSGRVDLGYSKGYVALVICSFLCGVLGVKDISEPHLILTWV